MIKQILITPVQEQADKESFKDDKQSQIVEKTYQAAGS